MQLQAPLAMIASEPFMEVAAMNHHCLHVDVTLNISPDEWLELCEGAVPSMQSVPGLVWKLWLLDRERARAGGLYLFQNSQAARAYAEGPLLERLRRSSAVRSLQIELWPIVDSLSRRTFGLSRSFDDGALGAAAGARHA
jgi:hypothetical protein